MMRPSSEPILSRARSGRCAVHRTVLATIIRSIPASHPAPDGAATVLQWCSEGTPTVRSQSIGLRGPAPWTDPIAFRPSLTTWHGRSCIPGASKCAGSAPPPSWQRSVARTPTASPDSARQRRLGCATRSSDRDLARRSLRRVQEGRLRVETYQPRDPNRYTLALKPPRVDQSSMGFSATTLTVIFGIYALGVLMALLIGGRLSDYLGRRPVLLAATAAQAASMLLFIESSETWHLISMRFVQGLITGAAVAAADAGLLDINKNKGGVANAVSPPLGTAMGGILSGIFVQYLPAPTMLIYSIDADRSRKNVLYMPQGLRRIFRSTSIDPERRRIIPTQSVRCNRWLGGITRYGSNWPWVAICQVLPHGSRTMARRSP
jgi:hypothetical protein